MKNLSVKVVLLSGFLLMTIWFGLTMQKPIFSDDFDIFYNAARLARTCMNPYLAPGFFSPVFILAYFIPLSLFPRNIAFSLNGLVCMLAYWTFFWHLAKGYIVTMIPLLITPFAPLTLWSGNVDWMPLLGSIVNPLLGVFLALAKPQMGLVLVAVLMLAVLKRYGILVCLLLSITLSIGYIASYMIGMRWAGLDTSFWNISLWPYGIVLGLVVAIYALRFRNHNLSLAAMPFLSPYIGTPSSWIGIITPLARYRLLLWVVCAASWLLFLYWRNLL